MLTVRLPSDIENTLNTLATKTHKPKSYFVISALQSYFETQKEYLDALVTLEDIKEGRDIPMSLNEVIKGLKLDQ